MQQLREWHQYSEEYGLSVARYDPYFAHLLCQQANMHRPKGKAAYAPIKFLLYQGDPLEQDIDPRDFRSRLIRQLKHK